MINCMKNNEICKIYHINLYCNISLYLILAKFDKHIYYHGQIKFLLRSQLDAKKSITSMARKSNLQVFIFCYHADMTEHRPWNLGQISPARLANRT